MQTFTFTAKQIKELFRAGIRRGEKEATAYHWGFTASDPEVDDCINAVYDIINEGKNIFDENRIDHSVVRGWFT